MKKSRKDAFNVNLDPEEQEIESYLPDTWNKLPFSANQTKELKFAKEAVSNYISKVKIKNIDTSIAIHEADNRRTNKSENISSIFKEI